MAPDGASKWFPQAYLDGKPVSARWAWANRQ
jgi:hypothetical protein